MGIPPREDRASRPKLRPPQRAFAPEVADLESRLLLSAAAAATPTADEQYMLQLLNQARANPTAEGQRLVALAQTDPVLKQATQGWDLSAFQKQIASVGSEPPLAFNPSLIQAARDHDATMLAANAQAHSQDGYLTNASNGPNGQAYFPVAAGTPWATGENVFAYSSNVAPTTSAAYDNYFHEAFLVDWGNADFGHLKNALAPGPSEAAASGKLPYNQVGIGLLSGTPTAAPTSSPENSANQELNVGPQLVTEEFAWQQGNAFLTGAVYRDLDGNNFYTPGEGLGGIDVVATGLGGQGTFTTKTWDSGGYSLQLPAGTYSVVAGGFNAPAKTTVVTIGADNVGWDVQYSTAAPADIPIKGDFDGDGKDDIAVYRPSTAQWFILGSSKGAYAVNFGQPGLDVPVPGDYDGTGHTEIAVYRPTTSQWLILGPNGAYTRQLGIPGLDVPVPGDYDGVGHDELAVYRSLTSEWVIDGPTGLRLTTFGAAKIDVPVPGDYDGDGRTDIAVYRPSTAQWFLLQSSAGARAIQFGAPSTDVPIPSDFDGDGKTDVAVYRPSTAQWLILGSTSGGMLRSFGQPGDVPIPADYTGDHRDDLATYTPSTAQWTISNSPGVTTTQFGQGGSGATISAPSATTATNFAIASTRLAVPAAISARSLPLPPRRKWANIVENRMARRV